MHGLSAQVTKQEVNEKLGLETPLNCFVSSSLDCLINVSLLTWLALVGLVQSRGDLFDQKCSEKKYRCIFI